MTVAAPAATAWRCSRLTSGAWRLEHIASGSVVLIAKGVSEAAVQRLHAQIEALIARLAKRRPRR